MSQINAISNSCKCNDNYDLTIDLPQSKSISAQSKVITLDFGDVRVGKEKSLRVLICNNTDKKNYYSLRKDTNTLSLYQCYKVDHKNFNLNSYESNNLKIIYKPLMPFTINYKNFTFVDSNGNETKIVVTGKSVGPNMQISSTFIKCNTWPDHESSKHSFQITNLSDFPVEYTFDIDGRPMPIFEIVPSTGVIEAKKHITLYVTFHATDFGEYTQRFCCMIHNHEPLMLDCFGVYWKSKEEQNGKRYAKYPEVIEDGYSRYMRDVQVVVKKLPAFSFIDSYFNFGTINLQVEKESTMVTSLTNHRDQAVIVKWSPDEYFKIKPAVIQIPANESVLIECNFRPTCADNIYSRHLLSNIFSTKEEPEEIASIPMPATLRALGHSFNERKFWIPQFEMDPGTLILPPVLPGDTCFTTVQLKSCGHLPTSFIFKSPTASNFLVKPMMGTVCAVTIVVVQLLSEKMTKAKAYVEQWFIQLNNDKNHRIPICLKGYAEYPSIVIGQTNTITLKGVQIGCEETVSVPISNNCQHHIHYEFVNWELSDGVKIHQSKGDLPANATEIINVSFKSAARICKQIQVTCLVYAVQNLCNVYGSPTEIPVSIYIESSHSDLCCIPAHFDFGTVECQASLTTDFRLFNYGQTTLHFKLSVFEVFEKDEEKCIDVSIEPFMNSIEPKTHVDSKIYFKPRRKGLYNCNIYYKLRTTAQATGTIHNTKKLIFDFKAKVIYPYFQIIEIGDHNFGPLFSKRSLWQFLNINWWNFLLSDANCDKSKACIESQLPDAEINDNDYYVTLLMQNVTPFPVHLSLKRRKLCDCELQELNDFLSIRKKIYQCPHRKMLKMSIIEEAILPNQVNQLTMKVNFSHVGDTKLSYILNLNTSRNIVIDFILHVIEINTGYLSRYNSNLLMNFVPVYMGEKQPCIRPYWYYNNTNEPILYQLVDAEFDTINNIYGFEVFKCLNPIGIIKENKAFPLKIKFQPIEQKVINLRLPLLVGESKQFWLNIRARGRKLQQIKRSKKNYVPKVIAKNVAMHLSTDRIRLMPFPIWSKATRMIFITNMSDDIMGYNWIRTMVDGICEVDVLDPNRVLRPKQTDTIIVHVKSFDTPCSTRIHLPCKLINHTKYLQHEKSQQDYAKRAREIQDEFIITENGISYPINEIEILPKPNPFYVTLALELEITSFVDRDIHYTAQEQLRLTPQRMLQVPKYEKIQSANVKASSYSLLSKPIHPSQPLIKQESFNDDLFIAAVSENEIDPNVDNIEFYRNVIHALLADVVFSNIFHEIMDIQKKAPPKYYTQIRPTTKQVNRSSRSQINSSREILNTENQVQMPFVQEVVHAMLLKSVNEIFRLENGKHTDEIDYYEEVKLPNICKVTKPIPLDLSLLSNSTTSTLT